MLYYVARERISGIEYYSRRSCSGFGYVKVCWFLFFEMEGGARAFALTPSISLPLAPNLRFTSVSRQDYCRYIKTQTDSSTVVPDSHQRATTSSESFELLRGFLRRAHHSSVLPPQANIHNNLDFLVDRR